MPRTKISEYSTTNSDNTDIESININEGCAPSGINNAIRELMVHLKEFQTGASSDPLTVAGTFVASGGATIAASAGTSASPSIHFSGDTNTGIFSPAADTIAFTEGGTEAMRITSTGDVGIGTTSPSSFASAGLPLVVGSGSGNTGMTIYSGTAASGSIHFADGTTTTDSYRGIVAYSHTANYMTLWTDATERMRIDSSGNVGIGVTPYRPLQVKTGDGTTALVLSPTTTTTGTVVRLDAANETGAGFSTLHLRAFETMFYGSSTERMRITSNGEVLVGGTTDISSHAAVSVQRTNAKPVVSLFRNDTSIVANDTLGDIQFYGNDTTSNTPTLLAYIAADASGTHAAGDNPTDLVFATTPDGTGTVAEAMRLTQAKNLKIGGTANRATTEGTNQVVLFNGTAPVGTLTNGVSFYSAAGEARVMDAAGNSTLLSPHDQSTNEWIFHSKHTPSGKVLRIDVERLLKFVNDHFGLDAVHEFIEQ